MTTSDDSTPLKRCGKGDNCIHPMGCWQPATLEYFNPGTTTSDGLYLYCKHCRRQYNREYNAAHRVQHREASRVWKLNNPEKQHQYEREYQARFKLQGRKRYRKSRYKKEYQVRWRAKHPDKARAKNQINRARKRSLPATFTSEQWQDCLNWWHGVCAYCGAQQSLFHVLERDHFVPMSLGGGYTADNIVPACRTCNTRKNNTLARKWINRTFSPRRAKQILERIQAYFDYVKSLKS